MNFNKLEPDNRSTSIVGTIVNYCHLISAKENNHDLDIEKCLSEKNSEKVLTSYSGKLSTEDSNPISNLHNFSQDTEDFHEVSSGSGNHLTEIKIKQFILGVLSDLTCKKKKKTRDY